jgi:predicted alpha/beta superfamily hydrolase
MKSELRVIRMVLVILFVLITKTVFPQQPEPRPATPIRHVDMVSTEVREITSAIDGQEYKLLISLPPGYNDVSKTFPAIYVLDGQWDFLLVSSLIPGQSEDGFLPPSIVVGITWGGQNPNYDVLRQRDFTPTKGRIPQTGNAPNFLSFIKTQLVPFIDSNYRTAKDDRAIMGTSSGGLFALFALFHEPTLFNRYIMTSPNLSYNYEALVADEKAYAEKSKQLQARLFMCLGELEGGKQVMFQSYVDLIRSSHFQGLELETMVIQGTGHHSSVAEGYLKGLRATFAPKRLEVSHAILDKYVGGYKAGNFTRQVLRDKDQLFFVTPEASKLPMDALTDRDFSVRGLPMVVHFKQDANGKITGLESENASGRHFNEKIR